MARGELRMELRLTRHGPVHTERSFLRVVRQAPRIPEHVHQLQRPRLLRMCLQRQATPPKRCLDRLQHIRRLMDLNRTRPLKRLIHFWHHRRAQPCVTVDLLQLKRSGEGHRTTPGCRWQLVRIQPVAHPADEHTTVRRVAPGHSRIIVGAPVKPSRVLMLSGEGLAIKITNEILRRRSPLRSTQRHTDQQHPTLTAIERQGHQIGAFPNAFVRSRRVTESTLECPAFKVCGCVKSNVIATSHTHHPTGCGLVPKNFGIAKVF